jgi:hypothetical protein
VFKYSYSCFKLANIFGKKIYSWLCRLFRVFLRKSQNVRKQILELSNFFFFLLIIHIFCYLAFFNLIPECEKCHEKMNLKIMLQFKIDNSSFFVDFSFYFSNFVISVRNGHSIAMVNIHDLANKKVSLSFNMLVFFLIFISVKPNWHHQTFL